MQLRLTNIVCPRGKLYEYRLPREWTWYREGHEDKIFREKKAKETFQAGLQYLPFFLCEAMADEDLIAYLRTNKLDPIRAKELPRLAWAEDKTKLEKAVEDYLAVCHSFPSSVPLLSRCPEMGYQNGYCKSRTFVALPGTGLLLPLRFPYTVL